MTLARAKEALDRNDIATAGELINAELARNPDQPQALFLLSHLLMNGGKNAMARLAALRACEVDAGRAEHWIAKAATELALERQEDADAAIQRAVTMLPDDPVCTAMLAHVALQRYDFEDAIRYATASIKAREHHQPRVARAFARLHRREWGEGWDDYHHGLGFMQWRDKQDYGIPEWTGQGGRVLVYGEQGLGDQLAYCSAFGNNVEQVVCHPKLANLLRRSLGVEVHGDQFAKEIAWDVRADRAINMAGYMRYTRRTAADFPGTPYLKPHPEKTLQWRALLDSLGGAPKIGIAWTGGMTGSHGWKSRNIGVTDFAPLADLGADLISLEYRDDTAAVREAKAAGMTVHSWPWATRTDDLDDVAALVACLDAVVCVPTTAYHVAGALGVPAHVIVHDRPHFHEGLTDERSPWWASVRFHRRATLGTAGAMSAVRAALLEGFE